MSRQHEVAEALADVGLTILNIPVGPCSGPSFVAFDRFGADVVDAIRTLSQTGAQRVLALWVGRKRFEAEHQWALLQAGASDVMRWNDRDSAQGLAARFERWSTIDGLVDSPVVVRNLVGRSRAWRCSLRIAAEVARFTDASVLISGETGTGKELVARLIHTLDPRPDKGELIIVDCTTLMQSLSASELFGHEKGAFTGAINSRRGAFALADGGTLFLDEIGELPPALQGEVLRAIQEGVYKPVGSERWCNTNFRLICATNRDLQEEERDGRFRLDLYHRIVSWRIHLPPLRERREDIMPLFEYFAGQCGLENPVLDDVVRDYLMGRSYAGNVRELRQLAMRMCHRHPGGVMSIGTIPAEDRLRPDVAYEGWKDDLFRAAIHRAVMMGVGLKLIGKEAEQIAVDHAIESEAGSLQRAAARLGVTARALQLRVANQRGGGDGAGADASRGSRAHVREAVVAANDDEASCRPEVRVEARS